MVRSGPEGNRQLQFVLVCWLIGWIIALGDKTAPGLPAELWPPVGLGFIAVTLMWDGHARPGRTAILTSAAMAATSWFVGLLFSYPPLDVAVVAVLNTAASWLMALLYSRVKLTPGWTPRGARSLAGLAGSALMASVLVSALGGFPDLQVVEIAPISAWWVIRSAIFAFIGGATGMIFFHGELDRWRRLPRPSRLGLALLIPVSPACLYVVFVDPDLPLSWFILIPAVWAGVMLSPSAAAVHALIQALTAGVLAFTVANRFSFEGFLPSTLIIDLLLVASTFITLQIALLRDERERALAAERALRKGADAQSTLLGQVFDSMTDGMMLFTEGALVRHNPAARHLLGRPLPSLPPQGWAAYLNLRTQNGTLLVDDDLPGSVGLRRHTSTVVIDHSDDRRILEVGSWPISEDDILVLLTDVTNQRHRLAELSRFAGIVSHDLRTPLTSLHGWLELARDAARLSGDETIEPMLDRAEAASLRMEHVIGGWINYTVVREGHLTPERVALREVITDVVGAAETTAPGPQIEVSAPHTVQADRALTRQLLANLIGNAVKFARPGAPATIEISSHDDVEPGWIRIDVADRGLGLPPGQERLIFDEFHRAPEHADGVEGTGLGLSLCRTIVVRHGGSITAVTNEHGGATISMTLPAAR